MRSVSLIVFGFLCWQSAAPAQTAASLLADNRGDDNSVKTGVVGAAGAANAPTYAPPTNSERLRMYIMSAFGPGAILRAVASGGIEQLNNDPKEWKQGSEAFGERIGNSLAEHVIRKTLESGGAFALHEDNRYFRSTDSGFWKRSKHAIGSVFVARNEAGGEHFAYSRFGGAIGASFISRIWQPPSTNSAGDAAVNFGLTMAADMGWNFFKEFAPRRFGRHN